MILVVTAEQHEHTHQEFACENRQRDAAGQSCSVRGVRALEIRVFEFCQDNRMTRRPGRAWQALIEAERHRLRDFAEFGKLTIDFAGQHQSGSAQVAGADLVSIRDPAAWGVLE